MYCMTCFVDERSSVLRAAVAGAIVRSWHCGAMLCGGAAAERMK